MRKQIILFAGAWVLWTRLFTGGDGWHTQGGFPTYDMCMTAERFNREQDAMDVKTIKGFVRMSYQCLPDTIDPRERKQAEPVSR